ncbi:cadherin-like domain-containing protein [Hydrogenophaga sp.]|uniref:cadherin-like domain-containing protein n=1 Tax=Hydrogenophaga sp. TaxID=1904254 RepID=UPI0035B2CB2A
MPITNTDRVLAALPYTINTYGTGPGTAGNPVGNSQPIKLTQFESTPGSGFQGNFYKDPVTGKYTVAFAGTNDGLFGPDVLHSDRVLATANLLTQVGAGVWDAQFTDAIRFTAEAFKQIQTEHFDQSGEMLSLDAMRDMVQVVGHSLGGSLAELSAQFFGLPGVNVDGPGVQALVGQSNWNDLKIEVGEELQGLQASYRLTSDMFGAYSYSVVGVAGTHIEGIEWQRTAAADEAHSAMHVAAGGVVAGSPFMVIQSAVRAGATALNHPGASILRETEIAAGLNPDAPMPQSPFTTLLVGGGLLHSSGEGPTLTQVRLNAEQHVLQNNVADGLSPTGLAIGETTQQGPFAISAFVDAETGRMVEVRVPVDAEGHVLGAPIRTEYVVDPQGHVGIVNEQGGATFITTGPDGVAAVVTVDPSGTISGHSAYGESGELGIAPETAQAILSGRQSLQQVLGEVADALDTHLGAPPQGGEDLSLSSLPDFVTPPTPGPGVVVADSGNSPIYDAGPINGYGDGDVQTGPAPAPQEPVGQSLGQWAATVTPEQVAALLQLLSENGLDAQTLGNVRILDNADGTQMLALDSASGYLTPIGQLQPSANDNGWTTLQLLGSDPDSPLHLGPQGQVFGHEQYVQASVQTATQGLNLFTGLLSGIENWGQLNTLQQLNTLTSIYSQIDNLGSAFAQGNHLPGNLGGAGGALAFLNALDGGSDYAVVSSGLSLAQQGLELWSNVLSNQAFDLVSQMGSSALVDVAMSQAYDSALQSAAQSGAIAQGIGEAIPYLNLIYSLSNIEENPMGAAISALSMMGPYGQLAAAVLTVFSMVMDNDIPPSIGEAEVQIDASGAVVVNTTQDEQGGGGTAAAWAQQLAQVAVGAGLSAPQAGAPAQHLPSVGYYHDPDGFNFENSNGQLALRWIDEDGNPQQLLYDSNGMRWDGNSVEGQSDIMRDYLLLMQSRQPQWPPVMYQEVTGGVLRLDYGVATVLYATALGTYDGMAGHMHGGDEDTDGGQAYIGVGSAQIHSLSDHTVESSTGQPTRVTLGAGQIQSVLPAVGAMGASLLGPQPPKGKDPIVFVPAQAMTGTTSQTVTAGMVTSLSQASLFGDAQWAATAMALGLGGLSFASHAAAGGTGDGGSGQSSQSQALPGQPDGQSPWGALAAPQAQGSAADQGARPGVWTDDQGRVVAPAGTTWPGSAGPTGDAADGRPTMTPVVSSDPAAPTTFSDAYTTPAATMPVGYGQYEQTASTGAVLRASSPDVPLDYPTVQADGLTATEDQALVFSAQQLLANDSTPNPVPQGYSGVFFNGMRVIAVGDAVHGQVGIRDGQLVFIPDANYNGLASFSYTVQDMYGMTQSGTVSLQVTAVNDTPQARGESATGSEDTDLLFAASTLLRNDSDIDGDRLRISRVGEASGGTVFLQADGSVRFVPTPNYNGPAGYAYWVSDGQEQVRADVRLNILQVNDLPVVQGELVASDEDVVLNFPFGVLLANDSDIDTDPLLNQGGRQTLSISAVGNAQHGVVEIVDGQVRFTPERDYFGPAAFDYLVDDGAGGQVSTTVILNLAPVNDAPDVQGESGTLAEDNAILYTQAALLANDSDVDNPHADLRITQVGGAVHGSVELLPDGRIRFVPDADYFGPAAFDYLVDDGVGGQSLATVTLEVTPVNDDPRLLGERVEIDEDTVVTVHAADLLANDHDVDNAHADLVLSAVGNAVNGSVTLDANGQITFTPTANFYGQASYSYTVLDGVGGSSTATVVLDYRSVNDLPVVNSEGVLGKRGVTYTFDDAALLANDTDVENPGQLQIVAVGGAVNGSVQLLPNGDVRFVPAADYDSWSPAQIGSFEYTVRDLDGGESTTFAVIDYSRVNLNPVARDDAFQGYEDVRMEINVSQLLRNDSDPDATAWSRLEVAEVADARHGSVSMSNGVVSFNPNRDFYGEASFRYRVTDGEGGSTWATAYIDIERENRPPEITGVDFFGATWLNQNNATVHFGNIQGSVSEGLAEYYSYDIVDSHHVQDTHRSNGRIYAVDPDGDAVTFSIHPVDAPDHGIALINRYLPHSTPRNLTPDQLRGAQDTRGWTEYGMGNRVVMEGFDPSMPDGGRRNYYVNDYSTNGSNAYAAWQYVATDLTGYQGWDSFVVTATDSRGLSATEKITVYSTGWRSGGGGCFPVVVDTGADGLDLVRPDESNLFADINGDGWREQMGWVASSDALLAYDADADGQITQREEISFVGYQPGARTDLEGLAAFDTNGDGVLSAADEQWQRFGLLQDANGNGVQDEGEFQSLQSLGATELALTRQGQAELNNGNVVFGTTTLRYEDGREQTAGDVMFAGAGVDMPEWVQAELDQASAPETAQELAEASTETDMVTPSGTADASVSPTPSIEQQASAFVQMVTTQTAPTEPLAFVDIQDVSLSSGAVASADPVPEVKADVSTASAGHTADELLAVPA